MIIQYTNTEIVGYPEDDPNFYNHEFANGHIVDKEGVDKRSLILLYFSTTTLSTVGFGDFSPINDVERVLTAIIMLIGVNCFSYIRNEICDMILIIKKMN